MSEIRHQLLQDYELPERASEPVAWRWLVALALLVWGGAWWLAG